MTDLPRLHQALAAAVTEINGTLPSDRRLEPSPDVALMGPGGKLDSMGLVNLVVAAEEAIEREFGVMINLGDSRAMSESPSPYRTLETLAQYASRLLREQGHG